MSHDPIFKKVFCKERPFKNKLHSSQTFLVHGALSVSGFFFQGAQSKDTYLSLEIWNIPGICGFGNTELMYCACVILGGNKVTLCPVDDKVLVRALESNQECSVLCLLSLVGQPLAEIHLGLSHRVTPEYSSKTTH